MDIIDEMVDLARLAYKSDSRQADELLSKIVARTSDFKLGRVLSLELARLRCSEKSDVEELQTEVEYLHTVLDEVDNVGATAIGLLDPDLHETIVMHTRDIPFKSKS